MSTSKLKCYISSNLLQFASQTEEHGGPTVGATLASGAPPAAAAAAFVAASEGTSSDRPPLLADNTSQRCMIPPPQAFIALTQFGGVHQLFTAGRRLFRQSRASTFKLYALERNDSASNRLSTVDSYWGLY